MYLYIFTRRIRFLCTKYLRDMLHGLWQFWAATPCFLHPAGLEAEVDELTAAAQQHRGEQQASMVVLKLEQQKLELVLDQLSTLHRLRSHRRQQSQLRCTSHRILAQAESTQRKVASLENDFQQLEEEKVRFEYIHQQ